MVYARVCQNSRLPAAAQSAAPRRQYSGAPVHEPSAHKDRLLGWLKEGQYRSRELTEIATYLNKHGLLQTGKEYCLLATALGKKYMWRGAVKLLSTLRGNAVQTDAYMCSNAVAACDTDGGAGWEHSVQIIMDMEINAMRRYEQVYNGAISACRKQQKWLNVLHLVNAMWSSGLETDAIACSNSVRSCQGALKWSISMDLLQRMSQRTQQPDFIAYASTISACGKARKWMLAMMLSAPDADLAAVPKCLFVFMTACGNSCPVHL